MANPYGFTTQCWELDGSPEETFTINETYKATVRLRCAWANRYNLLGEAANYLVYPRQPASKARCRGMAILPYTKISGEDGSYNGTYEDAEVRLEFVWDKKSPEDSGGELWSESLDPTVENLTLDYRRFRWSSGETLREEEAPSMMIRGLDYVLTHYNLTSIPAAALTLIGCVNNAAVTAKFLGLTFPAGTLLFNPPSAQRRVVAGTAASLKWTVTYRFTYKASGWNKFWDPRTQSFSTLQVNTAASGHTEVWTNYNQYTPAAFTGF